MKKLIMFMGFSAVSVFLNVNPTHAMDVRDYYRLVQACVAAGGYPFMMGDESKSFWCHTEPWH